MDGCDSPGDGAEEELPPTLSPLQTEKMTLFFTELLDMDRDDLVSEQDFQHFVDVSCFFELFSTVAIGRSWVGVVVGQRSRLVRVG